ncbi:MAG: multiheme c-type cytochrome [Gemmataceae bacterium]
MPQFPNRSRIALVAAYACLFAFLGSFELLSADPPAIKSPCSKDLPPQLFSRWPEGKKPDMVLFLSGEQHSYLKFCGCSDPQYGGFERRYNFLMKLKEKGWPVVAMDLGDIVKEKYESRSNTVSIRPQTILKYVTSMKELNLLGYTAVGVGPNDFNLPLIDPLFAYFQLQANPSQHILAANLLDRENLFPALNGRPAMLEDSAIVPGQNGAPTVGSFSVMTPAIRNGTPISAGLDDKTLKFADNQNVIPDVLKKFDSQKVDLRVLLLQGLPNEAEAVAKAFPKLDVILCRSLEEEPPQMPKMVGNTMIVNVGWRARFIGVVGAFRKADGTGFDLHYELVKMTPELETDKDKEQGHPVVEVLQEYAQKVKDDELMYKYPRGPHPLQTQFPQASVAFIGSDKCKMCHEQDGVWAKYKKTAHFHAYETLVKKAVKPTLRQYDGECIVCHAVGFLNNTGFVDEKKTPHLENVGCESCHGPGSLHASNPNNMAYRAALNPWRKNPGDRLHTNGKYDQNIMLLVDQMCQKCHDVDNDNKFKFERNWPKIDHTRRGQGPPPAPKE